MSKKSGRIRKILFWIAAILLLNLLIGLAVTPWLITGGMVNRHVDFQKTWKAEDFGLESKRVGLETEDGLKIVGYEVSVENPKAVIICLSGIHNPSVTAFFGHAQLFKEWEYSSLLVEMRAHGESEGKEIGLGFTELLDIKAALNYLRTVSPKHDNPIIIMGLSMGAATAINAAGIFEEIDGLISLSAFSSWTDVFCDNMKRMGAPDFFVAMERPFVHMYLVCKYGEKGLSVSPKQAITQLGSRPALLMHSTGDTQVPYVNAGRIMAVAPKQVQLFTVEGDHHFILKDDFTAPERDSVYTARLKQFLTEFSGNP